MAIKRRCFLQFCAGLGLGLGLEPGKLLAGNTELQMRTIPRSGERLPAIGMGTWLTFAVGNDRTATAQRVEVVRAFFDAGGRLIDSSPMYGSSEQVVGECLLALHARKRVFAATKVWTVGWQSGVRQMRRSRILWGVKRFDLMQIHNMLDWRTQLETLKSWKHEGRIRYIGITTSHGRRHAELEQALAKEDAFDFVQLTYNIEDRSVEQRLLPLAQERRIAVIVNRPFQGGDLFGRAAGRVMPDWAAELGCRNWAQFFLKFIIGHPAVTCVIPATSRVEHMRENMGALRGPVPDMTQRRKMLAYYQGGT